MRSKTDFLYQHNSLSLYSCGEIEKYPFQLVLPLWARLRLCGVTAPAVRLSDVKSVFFLTSEDVGINYLSLRAKLTKTKDIHVTSKLFGTSPLFYD